MFVIKFIRSVLVLSVVSALSARAQIIGAPVPENSGNQFPFGSPVGGNPGTRYQQVYDRNAVTAGPITGVRFFRTSATNGTGDLADARFLFSLSSTTRAVNNLNTRNFDRNLGADNTLVLDLTTKGINVAFGSAMTFNFTQAFDYNPADGNLLLDIQLSNIAKRGDVFFDGRFDDFGTTSSRAHNFGAGFESIGLVTEFLHETSTTVPEPSTYALMATGLAAIAFVRRRVSVR